MVECPIDQAQCCDQNEIARLMVEDVLVDISFS